MSAPDKRRPTYHQQLKGRDWKVFSHRMKEEANWQCQECGGGQSASHNLEVHHVFYVTGLPIANYPRALVMVLCGQCHEARQEVEQHILQNVAEILRTKPLDELRNQPIYAFFTQP